MMMVKMRPFKLLLLAAMLLLSPGVRVAAEDDIHRYVLGLLVDALPDSLEDALQNLVAGTNMVFDIVLEITGVNLAVVLMPTRLARLVVNLPFFDFIEEDQRVFLVPPNSTITETPTEISSELTRLRSAEMIPYGIMMVGAHRVSDANVANRKVCIIDSGYDLGHVDLPSDPSVVTGENDIGAGPWFSDGMDTELMSPARLQLSKATARELPE